MKVEIWSDVVCPWCSIGSARFHTALERFGPREQVEVVWRSFELDPSAGPSPADSGDYVQRLADKIGVDAEKAQGMLDGMTATAAAEGLDFRFDLARNGNTFDAHRLLHLAHERGLQQTLKDHLDRATFSGGLAVSDHAELTRVAVDSGLDEAEVTAVLASDRYADAVRADVAQARAYGISGVPFFVLDGADGKLGVSGAQSPEVLLSALEQAWGDRPMMAMASGAGAGAGDSCEGDSCAI